MHACSAAHARACLLALTNALLLCCSCLHLQAHEDQFLDKLQVERDRGITVKMHTNLYDKLQQQRGRSTSLN
eukprot:scaffold214799_cov19-Tisochrysis_lutea.AAC.1